ncbi:MAG TPA: hypothetical protein VKV26_18725 [Dehalococcoidia bacterium]|nr:hypothetical protein [Dehalococcoidia bacterium]
MIPPTRRLIALAVLLLCAGLGLAHAGGANAQAPGQTGPAVAAPVSGRLQTALGVGQHGHPSRPFLHPGGKDQLARGKQIAQGLARGGNIQQPGSGVITTAAQTQGIGFNGISAAESSCGCLPPDGNIAAGPNHVIGVVNTAVKIWNKSGALLLGPADLQTFFAQNSGCPSDGFFNFDSDPSSDYDAAANRFVMEILSINALTNGSRICIAVTQTADPTGVWNIYAIPVQETDQLFDFPHIAIGSDAIYVSGNEFNASQSFTGAYIYAFNKSVLYAGQTAAFKEAAVGNTASGMPADTVFPTRNVTAAGVMYFVGADNGTCPCSTVSVWKWANALGGGSLTLQGGVSVDSYVQPPDAVQPAGANAATIVTNDVRSLSAQISQGAVYSAHTVGCNPGAGTVACVQWYQLGNLDGAPTLIQQGTLGSDGEDRMYPALSVDISGDLSIGFAHSSASVFAGVDYTGRLPSDAPGALELPENVLKAGEVNLDGTRYGDYAGEVVDPDGCTVWHLEEYAQSGQTWGTWVGSFRFPSCSTTPTPDYTIAASPASQTVTAGGGTTYTATLTSLNGYASAVNLSISGLPAGANGSFNPAAVTPSGSSTLSVTTSASTPAGSYPLTITGTGTDAGHTTHSTGVTLVVNPASQPDFGISASPSSQSVNVGAGTTYTVATTSLNGFSGQVTLSVSGQPAGASAGFSVNPIAAGGSATLTESTTSSTPPGSYTLTITGTSGSLSHSTTVTLVVKVPDFSISASPGSLSVSRNSSGTYTVTIGSTNGFSGSVALAVSGLPAGATASFSPASVTPPAGGSAGSTLTVNTGNRRGNFTLTITGTSGSLSHSTTVTLQITR